MSLNTTSADIIYNLNKIKDQDLILNFSLLIDHNKLGYNWNICFIELRLGANPSEIKKDISKIPGVIVMSECIDYVLIVDIITKNNLELNNVLSEIKRKFNKSILNYEVQALLRLHKLTQNEI